MTEREEKAQFSKAVQFLEYYKDWMDDADLTYTFFPEEEYGQSILRLEKGYRTFMEIQSHDEGWVATMFVERGGRRVPPRDDPVADQVETTILGAVRWALKAFYDDRLADVLQDFQMREAWEAW